MSTRIIQIGLAILALGVLVLAVMWVAGYGPFHSPSAAAKLQPKVAATVAKAETAQTADVIKAEDKTKAAGVAAEKRTETHVAKLRAAPAGVADGEFYRGVCQSQLYAGNPDCRGYGGQP